MPVTHLSIRNYKSLESVDLYLNPFMVFVGPNNAGKSNIFDCLRFLSELVKRREIFSAVQERGGFEHIVFNGDLRQAISIELQGIISVKGKEWHYKYFLELGGDRYGQCFNNREAFHLLEDGMTLLEFPSQGIALVWDEVARQMSSVGAGRHCSYLSVFKDEERYPILFKFSKEVQDWGFFNFLPPLMRGSLPVRKELQLRTLGENLPIILHTLQTEYPQRFREIEDILKSAVPELEELATGLTSHETGQTYIRIREKGLKISISAWGMSDGTLRLLGHLVALYLPEPPPLVCFEEPENYVHPRLLELTVNLLKSASKKTQVLVSTHSPYFVDFLQPEDLFIVEKQDGKTKVKKAEEKKGIKEALKTLGLGEMWYSGSLGGIP